MKLFVVILLLLPLLSEGKSRFNGESSDTCENIILQQYNVNPTTCSSNFVMTPSTTSYTIGEPVHITIQSTTPDTTFTGILLLAQDDKDTNVGGWQIIDSVFESVSCGGMMHNSQVGQTSFKAAWHPSSTLVENIVIKAIIIENNATIYVNCYEIILTLRDEPEPDTSSTTKTTATPSASTASTTTQPTTTTTQPTTTQPATTTTQPATTSTQPATTATQPPTTQPITTQPPTTQPPTTQPALSTTTQAPSPTTDVIVDVSWTFHNATNATNVRMAISNLRAAQYAAIGIGLNDTMGENHVFMCKRLADDTIVINRYINPGGHHPPQFAGNEQGGVFTEGQQEFTDGVVVCRFSLSDFKTETSEQLTGILPLSQSTQYRPKFAVGLLNSTNHPQKHADGSVNSLDKLLQLNENHIIVFKTDSAATTSGSGLIKFTRFHGIMMVFAWILIRCLRV